MYHLESAQGLTRLAQISRPGKGLEGEGVHESAHREQRRDNRIL